LSAASSERKRVGKDLELNVSQISGSNEAKCCATFVNAMMRQSS